MALVTPVALIGAAGSLNSVLEIATLSLMCRYGKGDAARRRRPSGRHVRDTDQVIGIHSDRSCPRTCRSNIADSTCRGGITAVHTERHILKLTSTRTTLQLRVKACHRHAVRYVLYTCFCAALSARTRRNR